MKKYFKGRLLPALHGIFIGGLLVFLTLFASYAVNASVMSCDSVSKLDDKQVTNLYKSYQRGLQDDLGYVLSAISFKESSAGKYRINLKTNDYGSYGINIRTVQRLEKDTNYYRTVERVQRIIYDDDLGAEYALKTLRWNLRHHKGDLRKALMHYNSGNRWWLGKHYADEVLLIIKTLKTCLPM